MKKSFMIYTSLLLAGALAATTALAADFSLGAGVLGSISPYRGGDNALYPMPVVNYESDNFYFRGLGGGYYLWNDGQNRLSVTALYSPLGFKPSDNDDVQMKQLDKRRGTLMAGLVYSHSASWGILRTSLVADTLGYSDGYLWDNSYLYRFELGDWSLTPGVGVTWSSERLNRYYFGISGKEASRSGLGAYSPDGDWSPYAELSTHYRINDSWSAWATGRYVRMGDEVKESPMVDHSYIMVFGAGVSYRF